MELLQPNCFYHIYNHSNGRESIFLSKENYHFFLRRYRKFIPVIACTYSYCLMPNHFHFLIKTKNANELSAAFPKPKVIEKVLSKQFSNLFSSYTQAFNKQQHRMGSLFIKNFKRKKVEDKDYLLRLTCYIHKNPVHHGFCNSPIKWPYSSFKPILKKQFTFPEQREVLDWFGGLENFKNLHAHKTDWSGLWKDTTR